MVYAFRAKEGRFGSALLVALAFWAASSFVLSVVAFTVGADFFVSLAGFCAISALAYYFLGRKQDLRTSARGISLSAFQWVWRFILAGGIVGGAVLFSVTLCPLVGGVFASFPP